MPDPRPGQFALLLAALLQAAPVLAQDPPPRREEPVGWPLRTQPRALPVPMPVAPSRPAPTPAPEASEQQDAAAPPAGLAPGNEIAPIDRFLLPIRPLRFTFEDARTALTREETAQLSRLAQRVRGTDDRLSIVAQSDAGGRTAREALELSLTRALAVRGFLIREGVPVERIDLTALPHDGEATVAGGGSVRIGPATTGDLTSRAQD